MEGNCKKPCGEGRVLYVFYYIIVLSTWRELVTRTILNWFVTVETVSSYSVLMYVTTLPLRLISDYTHIIVENIGFVHFYRWQISKL